MATRSPSDEVQQPLETVVQQSLPQQADAVIAAETESEIPQQTIDLVTPDAVRDDLPPPAYGDTYGEIVDGIAGVGSCARITDNGRVNIRINQSLGRLSQILTPALRQQVHSLQDGRHPPPPYIPPSLGAGNGTLPPLRLNVVIQVVGSRGDVQPFVALGKALKGNYGHRVRVATHPTFKGFVEENGLEFFSIGGDPCRLMAFMVQNLGPIPSFRSVVRGDIGQRRKDVAEYIQGCWRSCYKADDEMYLTATGDRHAGPLGNESGAVPSARPFVADCIIANPPSFAHIHCAEKLGIPLHIMFTMPYSPSQAFPHPLANIRSSNADPRLTNYMTYAMIEVLCWQGLGDIINRFRLKCLGLDPVSLIWAPGMLERLKVPHTYCWSSALIPKPNDWGPHLSVSGFCFLDASSKYTPAPDLRAFLDAGAPPVYIGFGSIVLNDPNAMTRLIFEAVRRTGQRVFLSKGWGGIGDADAVRIPDGVFMLGNVPHDWLFKHVSCVVHHGGAGTTAAGIAAGRPTVVVPFFGDQPFWGAMVAQAGAGPQPIPHKQLTADRLAEAIELCLRPESLERAKTLARKVAAEGGRDLGAQFFHQNLEVDRLRCALVPSRPAVWRVRRTQVRLSAFAACTLVDVKVLDFRDLKLFRPREYRTDEGPWDPLSGGATALFGIFSNMIMGLADFPWETSKALHSLSASGRRHTHASGPTIASKSGTALVGKRLCVPGSPEQSRTSVNGQKSLGSVWSPFRLSRQSASTSDDAPSSVPDARRGQTDPTKHDNASRSPVRHWDESGSRKDHHMLRQTGVHTKSLSRIVKTTLEAPMDISITLTKGFHNVPKIWGDDTVRPQEQISDLKSGVRAMGKEFGYGMYDGISGLVTQPWKGAQKEGVKGFFKGFGKGIGGFATKPGAALWSVPAYMMKGLYKEVQKSFGGNAQSHIVASRVAQGFEEWLQSSEAEKQDVIARWKPIQKDLKRNSRETVRGVPKAQPRTHIEEREACQRGRPAAESRSGRRESLS